MSNTQESLKSQQQDTSADGTNNKNYGDMSKNEMDYERTVIEGTPFIRHYSKANGWSAGIAEHRLTGWFSTEKELLEKLKGVKKGQIDWDILTGVILILIEKTNELNKLKGGN